MTDEKTKDRESPHLGGMDDKGEETETLRRRVEEGLERLVPEVIKRTLEAGYDTLSRSERGRLRNLVNEVRIPRDVARYFLAQVDDTKNALLRVFAGEVRDFLEHTDLAEDLRKVLTSVSLEVSTQIRFIPNEAGLGGLKPEVDSKAGAAEKKKKTTRKAKKSSKDSEE